MSARRARCTGATTARQSRRSSWRNRRALGYQGLSLRLSSQRQSGMKGSRTHTSAIGTKRAHQRPCRTNQATGRISGWRWVPASKRLNTAATSAAPAGRVSAQTALLRAQSLIAASDVVVSAGGSMNREAVALGVPVYTTYGGRLGGVDETLIKDGRLRPLTDPRALVLEKRAHTLDWPRRDPGLLVDMILSAVGR